MNLAGISIAAGIALMVILALPFSLVLAVPAALFLLVRKKK